MVTSELFSPQFIIQSLSIYVPPDLGSKVNLAVRNIYFRVPMNLGEENNDYCPTALTDSFYYCAVRTGSITIIQVNRGL